MTRWKKGETRFTVRVSVNRHLRVCRIPKPIVEMLGDPESVTFSVKGGRITVN